MRLKGRRALVTGGGRGIGRAIAITLAGEGARVAIVTRGEEAGEATVQSIRDHGGDGDLWVADLGTQAIAQHVVEEVAERYGGLDILVHNAGVAEYAPLGASGGDLLDRSVDLNIKTAVWLAEAALPALRQSACARLLYVSSITGTRDFLPGFSAYAASKAGLNGFIRNAAVELGPMGIRVNGVEPGATLTDALKATVTETGTAALAEKLPLRHLPRPEDVAAAIAFLASDEATSITGQTIVVDAGQSLVSISLG